MFEDQRRYLDITNASGLACQTILLHIDMVLSLALKHYCAECRCLAICQVKEDSK